MNITRKHDKEYEGYVTLVALSDYEADNILAFLFGSSDHDTDVTEDLRDGLDNRGD